jgi:hypothetical protein
VRLGRQAHAEMNVWFRNLGIDARTDHADHLSLGDRSANRDRDRAELEKRDRVAVLSADRDRPPCSRYRARKGDHA